jgi:predicted nuclease of predicted toxin-antitoxin system
MKFIIDAQLPISLSNLLNSRGHDSIHTLEQPDKNKTKDNYITNFSIEEKRIVVIKDNDFLESFLIHGRPQKLILVRTGNIGNIELNALIDVHLERISSLMEENSLIEITKTEIVIHA